MSNDIAGALIVGRVLLLVILKVVAVLLEPPVVAGAAERRSVSTVNRSAGAQHGHTGRFAPPVARRRSPRRPGTWVTSRFSAGAIPVHLPDPPPLAQPGRPGWLVGQNPEEQERSLPGGTWLITRGLVQRPSVARSRVPALSMATQRGRDVTAFSQRAPSRERSVRPVHGLRRAEVGQSVLVRTSPPRSGDYERKRAIGEEMQRQLPKPSRRVPRWLDPNRPASEKRELAEGSVNAVASFGIIGLLAAVPGAIVLYLRRHRR